VDRASCVCVCGSAFLEQKEYAAVTGTHRTQSRLIGDALSLIGVNRLKAENAAIELDRSGRALDIK
jgi:hypothetical protein